MHSQSVMEEIAKRDALKTFIQTLLHSQYEFTDSTKDRVGRGSVHQNVSDTLGLVHNNVLVETIKEALAATPAKPLCTHGVLYYSRMRPKCQTA